MLLSSYLAATRGHCIFYLFALLILECDKHQSRQYLAAQYLQNNGNGASALQMDAANYYSICHSNSKEAQDQCKGFLLEITDMCRQCHATNVMNPLLLSNTKVLLSTTV